MTISCKEKKLNNNPMKPSQFDDAEGGKIRWKFPEGEEGDCLFGKSR